MFIGVNDAPSLATANVGVAMGHGAALAMETADVTLLDSNLEKLFYCIETGKKVTRKIKENVLFSIVVKLVVLGFAIAGLTHLWVAIASDVGSMILVTLNAMMILPKRQKDSAPGYVGDEEDGGVSPKASVVKTEKLAPHCSSGCCDGSKSKSCNKGSHQELSSHVAVVETEKLAPHCSSGCCDGSKSKSCNKGSHQELSSHVAVVETEKLVPHCSSGCCEGSKTKSCSEGNHQELPSNVAVVETEKAASHCSSGCCEGIKSKKL